jgi:hypothetical protein
MGIVPKLLSIGIFTFEKYASKACYFFHLGKLLH